MFFRNAFARPGMFASQRNNFQVPNAQPQPAPPPQQLPSGYRSQNYQTFSVQPGAENTVMGRPLSPAEREATYSNTMGMESPRPSMGIGDLTRRQGAMQAIATPPMASNTMGMEQPRFYQPPQMMGIMSLLSGLFGGGNAGAFNMAYQQQQRQPQRPQSVEDVLRSRGFNPPSKPTGMAMTADVSVYIDPVTGERTTGSGSMRPYHESLKKFYDQNPEALDIAKKYRSDAEERMQQQLASRKTNPFDQLGGAIQEPKAEPVRAVDMFGSPQGLGGFGQPQGGVQPFQPQGGFGQPQMGFGGKGGIKGGGMYGRPSYGMQARYSSPFQGFF